MWAARTLANLLLAAACLAQPPADPPVIPATRTTALDGHAVDLPRDLSTRATVLIIGFGRHSADATTAWEKPVRAQLAPSGIGFYDIAMLAEVPPFLRPMVVRAIRHEVPNVLRPNFLPLTDHEDDWKRIAGYSSAQPDAAYVLLIDSHGTIRWSTHEPFSSAVYAELKNAALSLVPKN